MNQVKNRNILWQPHSGPQTDFLASQAKRVMFGGALGPGKTDALMYDPLRYISHPQFQALMLRRTYRELEECMERARRIYTKLPEPLKWNGDSHKWRHPNGGFIEYGHCEHFIDWEKYLTKEYQRIYFDQLETFSEEVITNLWSRCRSTIKEIPSQIKCSSNPGGISHLFIKQKWIDRCPIRNRGEERYEEEFDLYWQPRESAGAYKDEFGITWEFHPAIIFDNPNIFENDPDYVRTIMSYPKTKRDAWLWGKWDIPMGQYFKEYDFNVHSNHELAKVPMSYRGLISIDWAVTGVFFTTVLMMDHESDIWAIDESWCEDESTESKAGMMERLLKKYPQVEVLLVPRDMNKEVKDRQADTTETMLQRFISYIDKQYMRGVYVKQADMGRGSRVPRWDTLRDALNWKDGHPWLRFIGKQVPKLVETLPTMIHDRTKSDDIDTTTWDHAVDSLGYGIEYINQHWRKKGRNNKPIDAYDVKTKIVRATKKLNWLLQ